MKIMHKLKEIYKKWKIYVQVDVLMYVVMVLFLVLLFVFFR